MSLEGISSRPAAEHTSAETAAALTRAFEGYLVPIRMSPQVFERRFRGEDLDPFASRVYSRSGLPVGVLLVARRGRTSRIAAMGVAPELRGQGMGRRIMGEAIDDARSRGDRAVLLEVIEQNTAALRLYESLGFRTQRRLVGYRRDAGAATPATADVLADLDPLDFARLAAREGEPDLPWMLAPETLSAAASPARAYHLEHRAYALVGDPAMEPLALTALLVPREHRRQGWGTRLVRALAAAFPGRVWSFTVVIPEDMAPGFFEKLGWERHKLSQLEMRLEIRQL